MAPDRTVGFVSGNVAPAVGLDPASKSGRPDKARSAGSWTRVPPSWLGPATASGRDMASLKGMIHKIAVSILRPCLNLVPAVSRVGLTSSPVPQLRALHVAQSVPQRTRAPIEIRPSRYLLITLRCCSTTNFSRTRKIIDVFVSIQDHDAQMRTPRPGERFCLVHV